MINKRSPREFRGSRQPGVPVRVGCCGRGAGQTQQRRVWAGCREISVAASGLCWPLMGCCARAPASPRERSEWRAPGVHRGGLEDHVL